MKQDFKEAAKWYQKAADQAHSTAQYKLGTMYFDGKGVRQDVVLAHMWTDLSAASANGEDLPERIQMRDTILATMSATEITESQKLKQEWKPSSPK